MRLEQESNKDPVGVQVPFNLSNNRKADVSDFKGTYYCNIREYFEVTD